MSHQLTFADSEFSTKRRQTRKEIFLSRMEQILPWQNMTAVIEPFYPKAGNGRRPYPLMTKGMGLGALMALIIGSAGASLTEVILLKSMFRMPMIIAFLTVILGMAILMGYLTQFLF
ncbi:hypothetical protein MB87_004801 [Salmonella enterica subsp. enterica serovar Emek]|nr:hypothetical protein [Salmonella enterica subsp. enterica serovar Emek]EEJ2215240.1 hypothetical protein [Salmonella enterica subsp. enterica serovar Emek]